MCGRGRCTLRPDDFVRACHLNSRPVRHLNMDRYQPAFNVAPGFNVPVVRRDDEGENDGVVLHCMKWGLIPSFTKKTEKIDHFRMFNARSESIREKASFRRLIPKNRCLVSFEGFYEWKKDGSKKQPYYIHFKDGRPLVFAALFDSWKSSEGEILYTFTIITTSSSSSLGWLHDRMPVILGDKESIDYWLNDSSQSNLDKILKPYEGTDLAWYPVTPAMGKVSFDGPECIKEIQVKTEETKTISQFFKKKDVRAPEEPKLETPRIKEESDETSVPKCVKPEPESPSTLESTRMKDEHVERSPDRTVKAEPGSSGDHDIKNEDCDETSDVSSRSPEGPPNITEKRDYTEFSAHSKPFGKETDRKHITPAQKRTKGMKKAKLKRKIGEDVSVALNALQGENEKIREMMAQYALRRDQTAALFEEKQKQKAVSRKQMADALQVLADSNTRKDENKILMMNIDSIGDFTLREYFRKEQARIIEKREIESQPPPPLPDNNMFNVFGTYFPGSGGSGSDLGPY